MSFLDINVFVTYSHKDEEYRRELGEHLKLYERKGDIVCWSDRVIISGEDWEGEIQKNLENADIILALLSSSFFSSDYCYDKEMQLALKRNDCKLSRLIPIIVRHVSWSDSPLGRLQALPTDGKPISTWTNRDDAWANATQGILKAVHDIKKQKKGFLNFVQSFFGSFVQDRTELIADRESVITRNISRLELKNRDLWNRITEYHSQLKAYISKFSEDLGFLYKGIYGGYLFDFLIITKFMELFEFQLKCLTSELGIVQDLEGSNFMPSYFGLQEAVPVMKEMGKTVKSYGEIGNSLADSLRDFKKNILEPVKKTGEEELGDEFEEV